MSTLKSVIASTGVHKRLLNSKEKSELLGAKEKMDVEDFDGALDILEDLNNRHPDNTDVGELLAFAYLGMELHGHALRVVRKLLRNGKRTPLALAAAVQVYMEADVPCSTLKIMDDLEQSFPDIEEFRKINSELRPMLEDLRTELLADDDLPEKTSEFLEQMEEIKLLGMENKFKNALQLARSVAQQYPRYAEVLVLAAHLYWTQADIEEATIYALKTLEADPDNARALLLLTQINTLNGERQKAVDYANEMLAIGADDEFIWLKQCEALAYVGDDQGLLHLWKRIGNRDMDEDIAAGIKHLVATAAAREGNEEMALALWKESVDVQENPHFETAFMNLAMMEIPIEERYAPWHFGQAEWMPSAIVESIRDFSEMEETDEETLRKQARQLVAKYPFLEKCVEPFLDRGDPSGCFLAVILAKSIASPELHEALRAFSLGRRGSDLERGRIAMYLFCHEALEADENDIISLWVRGQWQDVKLIRAEIVEEEPPKVSKKVKHLLDECAQAVEDEDSSAEERLLRRVLQMDPNCAFAYFALSGTLEERGEVEESLKVLQNGLDRLPENLLIRAKVAFYFSFAKQIEEAESLLEPLHRSETLSELQLRYYLLAQIQLSLYEKGISDSKAWLNLFQINFPDEDNIDALRAKIDAM